MASHTLQIFNPYSLTSTYGKSLTTHKICSWGLAFTWINGVAAVATAVVLALIGVQDSGGWVAINCPPLLRPFPPLIINIIVTLPKK